MRVDAAAPLDALKSQLVRLARNLLGLSKSAMVAPEVVLIQRLQPLAYRNHARTRRIKCDGGNGIALHPCILERLTGRSCKRGHLVCVRLRRVVRIFATPMQWVRSRSRSYRPLQ